MNKTFKYLIFIFFITTSLSYAQEMTLFLGLSGYQYYEDDRPIKTPKVKSLMETNQEAFAFWKKSRTYNTIAFSASAVSIATTVIAISSKKPDENYSTGLVVSSLGSALVGVIFTLSANHQKKKAVLQYNRSLEKKNAVYIKPLHTSKGVGIAIGLQ